jgi:malate dehydrogenase (oxaloacetate-decarboxylating)
MVEPVKPTVLIGTTGQPGMFSEEVVRAMARGVERPAIFPLSNPTSRSEATPADLNSRTDGRALVATGSPFPDVSHGSRTFKIAQCNNVSIFPGVGLRVIASRALRVSETMFLAATRALGDASPSRTDRSAALFPPLEGITQISRRIAMAAAAQAQREGLAEPTTAEELERRVDAARWDLR